MALVKREMGIPDSAESADRWALDHLLRVENVLRDIAALPAADE